MVTKRSQMTGRAFACRGRVEPRPERIEAIWPGWSPSFRRRCGVTRMIRDESTLSPTPCLWSSTTATLGASARKFPSLLGVES